MKVRIEPIDGLRAVAVLGVLWAHTWGLFGALPLKIGPVDINRVLSFGRNGVDLFFVISGFCMYLMFGSKVKTLTFGNYKSFLWKRLARIGPAYYASIIASVLVFLAMFGIFPLTTFIYHCFFINIFLTQNDFPPHFWSLATEWHFYLIFPLIFLGKQEHLVGRILLLCAACLLCRLVFYYQHSIDIANSQTVLGSGIWNRFTEFAVGILAAKFYLSGGIKLPRILGSLLVGLIIAYIGRIFMLTEFIHKFGKYAFIPRAFSEPLMTLGFALIVYNVITRKTWFSQFLSTKPILFIGRISFSIYLWHWMFMDWLSKLIISHLGASLKTFNLCLFILLAIIIPVSFFSYKLLEAPYFKKGNIIKKKITLEEIAEPGI